MKPFSAEEINKIVNGKIIQGSPDTLIKKAVYYVENINSSNTLLFLRVIQKIDWKIISQYAPCVVVTDKELEPLKAIKDCTVIKVDNIELGFWAFIYFYRNLFHIPVVAVTGTCGKSTTKEMIIHLLRSKWKVEGTLASANSRTHNISYLTEIDDSTEAAVFETAVGRPGDLNNCCKYYKPTIGIITNISLDHMKGCKTMENYIKAKGEMLNCIGDKGTLIINVDDENIKKIPMSTFKGTLVTFGIKNSCDFQGSKIEFGDKGMKFILTFNKSEYKIFVPGYGEHQVYNALAALAAVYQLGFNIEEAAMVLKSFKNLPLHVEVIKGINGSVIINDTWNTNLSSLKAGIEVLNGIAKGRKRIALIGEVGDLEDLKLETYIEIGKMIGKDQALDILITIGNQAGEIGCEALKAGFKGEVYPFKTVEGIYELLEGRLNSNAIILIKSAGYHDWTILDLAKSLEG